MTCDFDRAVDHIVEALLTISQPGSLVTGVDDNGDVLLHGPTGFTVRLIESYSGTAMEWKVSSKRDREYQSRGSVSLDMFDYHSGSLIQNFLFFLGI